MIILGAHGIHASSLYAPASPYAEIDRVGEQLRLAEQPIDSDHNSASTDLFAQVIGLLSSLAGQPKVAQQVIYADQLLTLAVTGKSIPRDNDPAKQLKTGVNLAYDLPTSFEKMMTVFALARSAYTLGSSEETYNNVMSFFDKLLAIKTLADYQHDHVLVTRYVFAKATHHYHSDAFEKKPINFGALGNVERFKTRCFTDQTALDQFLDDYQGISCKSLQDIFDKTEEDDGTLLKSVAAHAATAIKPNNDSVAPTVTVLPAMIGTIPTRLSVLNRPGGIVHSATTDPINVITSKAPVVPSTPGTSTGVTIEPLSAAVAADKRTTHRAD